MGVGEQLFGLPAESLPIAKTLLTVTMVVYGIHLLLAWRRDPSLDTLLRGGSVMEAYRAGAIKMDLHWVTIEPWRILSACFVHFGVIHIAMNMTSLLYLCRQLEPAIGSVRLLILYVVSGTASFVVSLAYYSHMRLPVPTAGASGAVFGLAGALLGFLLRRRDERWKAWLVQFVPAAVIFGLAPIGINNAAHIGGFVAGFLLGLLFAPGAPQRSRAWQKALAAVCAVAVVASLVLARLSEWSETMAIL
jgi:membrane associated rhomboid family serine protease